jgi:hypothetical protein
LKIENCNSQIDGRRVAWWLPCLVGWGVFLAFEVQSVASHTYRRSLEWLLGADLDALACLAFLTTAPLIWWIGPLMRWIHGDWPATAGWPFAKLTRKIVALFKPTGQSHLSARAWFVRLRSSAMSIFVGAVSLAASAAVGANFGELPAAYHDEYSYLFQARTFLAGRVALPSHVAPRLFDQMHVLNEGQFASRYFPGAGLWMAPFVALGHPYWGHWLAGAICAVLMFWIGRELAGDTAGLFAGLITALSPGMALFSNLLLAHHPTLVGLSVFILGFFRMVRSGCWVWALVSGTGLAFAMLCRPMTAAGVALPFGVWFLIWLVRSAFAARSGDGCRFDEDLSPRSSRNTPFHRMIALSGLFVLPLILALASLFAYDKAITGSGWQTPYSLYTSLHTPRHVYGFNNVERGRQHLGPRVIENYDKWAENLTPALALENVCKRWTASWKWTLGLLPQTLALCGGLVLWRRLPGGAWLVLAAILSLHAVHIPYWFAGMEDHHYVFESGPLWAVWIGIVTIEAIREWKATKHHAIIAWWTSLLATAVAMNWTVSSGLWSAPLKQGINRVAFARFKHGQFADLVARQALPGPALVLVEDDPADRHIDYVVNPPDLHGPVLVGHYLPDLIPVSDVQRLFPDRRLFLYRVREDEWRSLESSKQKKPDSQWQQAP